MDKSDGRGDVVCRRFGAHAVAVVASHDLRARAKLGISLTQLRLDMLSSWQYSKVESKRRDTMATQLIA